MIHIVLALNANSTLQAVTGNPILGSFISAGYSVGYWLYLLAAIAMIVGPVLTLRMPMLLFDVPRSEPWQQEEHSQRWPPSEPLQ